MAGKAMPADVKDELVQKISNSKRSFTEPARLRNNVATSAEPEIGSAAGIETLFNAPTAIVVKFEISESQARFANDGAGGLPWTSFGERNMASGPLEVYRVPGSVSFLRSGSLLHAILPRSLCWCVDGSSKFVLRVLLNTYYRIELPSATSQDLQSAELFKQVLAKISFYERERCPFARGFTVDLPESKPRTRKSRRSDTGPARKWRLRTSNKWSREGEEELEVGSERRYSSDLTEEVDEDEEVLSSDEDRAVHTVSPQAEDPMSPMEGAGSPYMTPTKPNRLNIASGIVASPRLTIVSSPPSKLRPEAYQMGNNITKEPPGVDLMSNPLDPARLVTFQNIPIDMPPSPADSSASSEWANRMTTISRTLEPNTRALQADIAKEEVPEVELQNQDPLDVEDNSVPIQSTGSSKKAVDLVPIDKPALKSLDTSLDTPSTPERARHNASSPATSDQVFSPSRMYHGSPEVEDQFAQIQARIAARRSIGGSGANTPTSQTRDARDLSIRRKQAAMTARQQAFGTALVQKACQVFLGPPAHLVALMLQIARKFKDGALDVATTFVYRDRPLRVPGSFESTTATRSEASAAREKLMKDLDVKNADDDLEEWDDSGEDDFGVPIRSPIRIALENAMAVQSDLRSRPGHRPDEGD